MQSISCLGYFAILFLSREFFFTQSAHWDPLELNLAFSAKRGVLKKGSSQNCPSFLGLFEKPRKNQGELKVTEKAQNADFRRKPQIFADSPLLLEIPAFGGRRKPQKTADFRRKPQIFAGNRRLGSVTLGASPSARP